jgi:hypothetical protein
LAGIIVIFGRNGKNSLLDAINLAGLACRLLPRHGNSASARGIFRSFPWTRNGDVGERVDCFLDMARGAILPFRRGEYRKEQDGREDEKAGDD